MKALLSLLLLLGACVEADDIVTPDANSRINRPPIIIGPPPTDCPPGWAIQVQCYAGDTWVCWYVCVPPSQPTLH